MHPSHSILVFLVFSFSLLSQEPKTSYATKSNLEGHWRLLDAELVDEVPFLNFRAPEPDPMTRVSEDSPWDSYRRNDLVFEQDTMYSVIYPIEMLHAAKYWLDAGYVHVKTKDSVLTYPAEIVNDTLLLYTQLSSEAQFFKERYVRTNFNDSVLGVLKKYGVNYPELAGTWYLIREEDYDYGTHYELKFPYSLPDSIVLTRQKMIAALENEKTFLIRTSGVKRDYSFYYENMSMYFIPGKWFKGDDPYIHFYKKLDD